MNHVTATADRLLRLEAWARHLVARKPGRAATELALWRIRKVALNEGLVDQVAGESPATIDDRIQALEEAFAGADRCRECGRALSDPESRRIGIGPDCLAHLKKNQHLAAEGPLPTNEETP